MGNIAKALLKAGAKLGVSRPGSGNVNESGKVSFPYSNSGHCGTTRQSPDVQKKKKKKDYI